MPYHSSIKFYLRIRSTDGNIKDCLLLICAFIISDVTQCIALQFVQNLSKNNIFGFSVVFSRKIVQTSIFEVEYLENGLAAFNDFGLILQDFEQHFKWYQLVLALQFSFKITRFFKNYMDFPCENKSGGNIIPQVHFSMEKPYENLRKRQFSNSCKNSFGRSY